MGVNDDGELLDRAGIANGQDAQDAGVSFFEHILVCTNSMA